MTRIFTVIWLDKSHIAKGYSDACEKCINLIKQGYKAKIVIEYEDLRDENIAHDAA